MHTTINIQGSQRSQQKTKQTSKHQLSLSATTDQNDKATEVNKRIWIQNIPDSKGRTQGFKNSVEGSQDNSQKVPFKWKSARWSPEQVFSQTHVILCIIAVRYFSQ